MYKEYPKFYNYEVLDYGRKSRTDDPLLSVEEVLEKHDKILQEYAEKYLGGPIPKENKFREVGSGESLDSRPEILRVLKAIESPSIKAVMVVDVQRLSRGDLEDAGRLIKILRYTNTYVITPYKTYDLRDEYDRDAFERELKRGNEYLEYYKKIQARGKLASVKEGNFIGSTPPYGYEKVSIVEDKRTCHTLVEKKEEADAVRMIFNWYCNEDIGAHGICRRLESLGIKSKNGNPKWFASFIYSILENVHYIGYVRWNWRKTIKVIEDQEVKVHRYKAKDTSEYLLFKGKHEPIISEELFYKAQEMRGKRHRARNDLTLRNPLSGLIYCKCGYKLSYNSYRARGVQFAEPKLACSNQVRCKSGSILFDEMYQMVLNTIRDCIVDFEVRINEDQDDSVKLHRDLITRLERKIKELEEKEMAQWEAQYDPDPDKRLPMEIFKKLNKKLLAEKEEVNQALCTAKESMPEPIDYEKQLYKFKEVLEYLEDDDVDASTKNQYLKSIIERIDYERGPTVRVTKENAEELGMQTGQGMRWYTPPYKINIKLKYV